MIKEATAAMVISLPTCWIQEEVQNTEVTRILILQRIPLEVLMIL